MSVSPCGPLLLDAGDLDARELLTVALALLVAGLVLELLDHDLGAAEVVQHLGRHRDLRERLGVGGDLLAIDEEDRGELDVAVLVSLDAVHRHDGADFDLLLPTAGAHYCVNHYSYLSLGNPGDPSA